MVVLDAVEIDDDDVAGVCVVVFDAVNAVVDSSASSNTSNSFCRVKQRTINEYKTIIVTIITQLYRVYPWSSVFCIVAVLIVVFCITSKSHK